MFNTELKKKVDNLGEKVDELSFKIKDNKDRDENNKEYCIIKSGFEAKISYVDHYSYFYGTHWCLDIKKDGILLKRFRNSKLVDAKQKAKSLLDKLNRDDLLKIDIDNEKVYIISLDHYRKLLDGSGLVDIKDILTEKVVAINIDNINSIDVTEL